MRCGGVGRIKPTNGDWTAVIECRTCGGTGWKKSIGYQPPDNRYDDSANDPLPVTAIPASVRQFVMDASHLIVSEAAAPNGSMENRALRRSWLAAIAELGMGEEDARAGEIGLWKRGYTADQNEEDGA